MLISNNHHFMENTKIIFEDSGFTGQEMQVYAKGKSRVFIKIYHRETPDQSECIELNKATACKLSNILKREISKIN